MKKENNTNTSSFNTYETDANLKDLLYSSFCDDATPLHNFEFR